MQPQPKPLRQWRRLAAVSIEELAKRAGTSTRTIVEIENNRVNPKTGTVRKLCAALNLEPGDVLEFATDKRERQPQDRRP